MNTLDVNVKHCTRVQLEPMRSLNPTGEAFLVFLLDLGNVSHK